MRRAFALLLVGLISGSGCTDTLDPVEEVERAISRTERLPRDITYVDMTARGTVAVDARLEDAFRYRARVRVGERDLLEQVVHDDSLAARTRAPDVYNPGQGTSLDSLFAEGVWVQDPAGAPPVYIVGARQEEGRERRSLGVSPVSDALNVLEYVRTAIQEGGGVFRFDEDSPFYLPSQDPFRGFIDADERAGIERFDVARVPLPQNPEAGEIPGSEAFRKMAIYVKDGLVVRVLEEIDIEGHEEIVEAREEGGPEFLIDVLEAVQQRRGDETVRPREMSVRFDALGTDLRIALPDDARTASLAEIVASNALYKFPDSEGGPRFRPDLDGQEEGGAVAGLAPEDTSSRD